MQEFIQLGRTIEELHQRLLIIEAKIQHIYEDIYQKQQEHDDENKL